MFAGHGKGSWIFDSDTDMFLFSDFLSVRTYPDVSVDSPGMRLLASADVRKGNNCGSMLEDVKCGEIAEADEHVRVLATTDPQIPFVSLSLKSI